MNLTSCGGCGVVLDKDKLIFPDTYDDDGSVIDEASEWSGREGDFIAVVPCPVCKTNIREYE